MKAMILAAGEGTRLRPHTLNVPKPMLDVSGRPTIEWIMLWLKRFGIHDVVVNLHHKPEPVLNYFGNGEKLGMHIFFSVEKKMLGTAGGLKRVEKQFDGPFVVVYGDILTDMNLGELIDFHNSQKCGPHATLSLCTATNPWECGIVAVDENHRVTKFVEKPPKDRIFSDLTNAGILIFDQPLLDYIPAEGFSDISYNLLPKLMESKVPIFAKKMDPDVYLIDIGSPEKYAHANREWPTPAAKKLLELA
jgi:mannose-1-phosphate guanylyltransferase